MEERPPDLVRRMERNPCHLAAQRTVRLDYRNRFRSSDNETRVAVFAWRGRTGSLTGSLRGPRGSNVAAARHVVSGLRVLGQTRTERPIDPVI